MMSAGPKKKVDLPLGRPTACHIHNTARIGPQHASTAFLSINTALISDKTIKRIQIRNGHILDLSIGDLPDAKTKQNFWCECHNNFIPENNGWYSGRVAKVGPFLEPLSSMLRLNNGFHDSSTHQWDLTWSSSIIKNRHHPSSSPLVAITPRSRPSKIAITHHLYTIMTHDYKLLPQPSYPSAACDLPSILYRGAPEDMCRSGLTKSCSFKSSPCRALKLEHVGTGYNWCRTFHVRNAGKKNMGFLCTLTNNAWTTEILKDSGTTTKTLLGSPWSVQSALLRSGRSQKTCGLLQCFLLNADATWRLSELQDVVIPEI